MNCEYQTIIAIDLLNNKINRYANKQLKPYNIKFNELNIIRYINEMNENNIEIYEKNLCQKFHIVHSTMVGIVFRLEFSGFILVGDSNFDKRHTRIRITDKGKKLLKDTDVIYQEVIVKLRSILSIEEMEKYSLMIDKIEEIFK